MRYNVQSASVLNEADRFQAILDWQLFAAKQDAMLFGYRDDVSWKPGDQLYKRPHQLYEELLARLDRGELTEEDMWSGEWGNAHRFMIDIFEDADLYMTPICKDCDVSWMLTTKDSQCWVCGKAFPGLKSLKPIFSMGQINDGMQVTSRLHDYVSAELERELGNAWRTAMQRFLDQMGDVSVALHGVGTAMRGMSAQLSVLDEATDTQAWYRMNPDVVVIHGGSATDLWGGQYHPPARPRSVFEQPDSIPVELVPDVAPGVPIFMGPGDGTRTVRLDIPANLDLSGRRELEKPRFEMPEIDYNLDEPRSFNTPITQLRRMRNL